MKGLFMDAVDDLAQVFARVARPDDPPVTVNEQGDIPPEALPGLLAGYDFVLDDHTQMPTKTMRRCEPSRLSCSTVLSESAVRIRRDPSRRINTSLSCW